MSFHLFSLDSSLPMAGSFFIVVMTMAARGCHGHHNNNKSCAAGAKQLTHRIGYLRCDTPQGLKPRSF